MSSLSSATFTTSHNPRTGAAVATLRDSTRSEVRSVVQRAEQAALVLAETSPHIRERWLSRLGEVLVEHVAELAELADTETALGLPRLRGEVERTADQLRFYASVATEGSYLGVAIDHPTRGTFDRPPLVRVNRPLGPVAVFGASNFPLAFGVLGNDTASALAAGCSVVVKAHPAHPRLSKRLADIAISALDDAGAPQGALGMVSGWDAGVQLAQEPAITAIGFTGSQSGGMALWRLVNERPEVIPIYAEMGTVNPVVLTPRSVTHLSDISEGFVRAFTLGSGQYCTKPGLILVPAEKDAPRAIAAAVAKAGAAGPLLTEAISSAYARSLSKLCDAGAHIIARVPGSGDGWSADVALLSARVEDFASSSSPLLDECFGPAAIVVEYASFDDVQSIIRSLRGSLVGSVMTDSTGDDPDADAVIRLLERQTGRVTVDAWGNGVAWTWAQHHGGPWPSTSAPAATSVGSEALSRWVRPVTYQSTADPWLPAAARAANLWHVPRRVDGVHHNPLGLSEDER